MMIQRRSAHWLRWLAMAAFVATTMSAIPTQASEGPAFTSSSDDSFILLTGKNSTMMRGSTADLHEARRLRSGGEPLLYFRRDGKAYVVRDAAVLRQAEAIMKPQADLGARQGELGARQGALGARQGELGRQQATLAVRQVSGGRADATAREQEELGRQ